MAQIYPFQAWRYAPDRVPIAQVVTQPYDKITPEMQKRYYQANPSNLVRIILGERRPEDCQENVYSRAAASFKDWRSTGILLQDSEPSIYRYLQNFTVPGSDKQIERQGFIALGRLENYSTKVVFPHELTHSGPKADRLELLRATKTHFEQIFMLYADSGEIEAQLRCATSPDIEVIDEYGVLHRVWKVSDPARITALQTQMREQKLIIADGHHRYETALAYRDERRTGDGRSATAPYNSMMMTFFNMNSPGLVILPTHRVVHGLASFSADQLLAGAQKFFEVKEVDSALDAPGATALMRETGSDSTALIVATADRVFLMHSPKTIGSSRLAGLSLRQQSLDVVQLHKCLLEGVLNISEEAVRKLQNISYYRDAPEALTKVRSGDGQAAFLMNPVRMDQIRDIAFAGEVLPQKSTDFYPKLLSGLTIYAME
ncbi:MAG: DUF1015 domain-containing protein [Acidobacteria bacterium]|nr:MAG: DUF1015 domain-containing protein [Acidobacteriota bacterium]